MKTLPEWTQNVNPEAYTCRPIDGLRHYPRDLPLNLSPILACSSRRGLMSI
ncbi:hypothetical protein PROFUN_03080 [Planoprotostelium fungivorum]|uniref:Uncharacterized protein n=1 Tax=Planoprotostelium fungivorum TaxID=1890364 RepID=A0A2P6NQ67_9EUKA|nr:hypothetical protein PROFUN_03080 [Planoprotostelium fungivorum]